MGPLEISVVTKNALLFCLVGALTLAAAAPLLSATGPRVVYAERRVRWQEPQAEREIAARVDAARRDDPGSPAPWSRVVRRISLALTDSVPSLEELRALEAVPEARRADVCLDALLRDRRTHDTLAERFSRALVGTADGPFLRFRRRRFVAWLSDDLAHGRPFDVIVREAIAARGVWTDVPAASFLTQSAPDDAPAGVEPTVLAARLARAVLGKHIDCAQCHDHPFASFTRDDFAGLASFFAATRVTLRGVRDVGDPPLAARVPFEPELLPVAGAPRSRLAAWATRTRAFPRATVNRVWSWMLGTPIVAPVDDVGDAVPPELDILADDFAAHGYDLRRLVRVIAATRIFRGDALAPSRLGADAVAKSDLQVGALGPRAESNGIPRLLDAIREAEMARRFGRREEDDGEEPGTIAQRLLIMNADDGRLDSMVDRIASARTDRAAVQAAFLVVLTRYPSPAEALRFEARVRDSRGEERRARIADLLASLVSSTEASWRL